MVVREYGRYQDFDSRHKNRVKTPTSSVGLSLFDVDVGRCFTGFALSESWRRIGGAAP
jgi:hypothetical protein